MESMSPQSSKPSTPVSIAKNRIHSAFKSLGSQQYSRFLTQLTPPASPPFQSPEKRIAAPTGLVLEAPKREKTNSLPELDEAVIDSVKWVSLKEVSMKDLTYGVGRRELHTNADTESASADHNEPHSYEPQLQFSTSERRSSGRGPLR